MTNDSSLDTYLVLWWDGGDYDPTQNSTHWSEWKRRRGEKGKASVGIIKVAKDH